MRNHRSITALFLISLVARIASELDYSELEALGVTCPERDKCEGQAWQDRTYMERNCECDAACHSYGDCCIDAGQARRSASSRLVQRTDKVCMNFGVGNHTGVYVVAHCSSSWNGSQTVREKCEGPTDFSDPMVAAPVTSIAQSVTYRNLFCAECNYANMQYLKTFQFQLACDGLDDMTEAQIIGDLFYDQQRAKWGVNRLNARGEPSFVECDLVYDVPEYVYPNVRFCRANVVSKCARNWTRSLIRSRCEDQSYMAVVYDDVTAYKNPHCALCNHKRVSEIGCRISLSFRKRPMSFALLLDVNQSDGDQVGMTQVATPQCPSGNKYDPFFKKCRKLVCALPGYQVVNGRCAPSAS